MAKAMSNKPVASRRWHATLGGSAFLLAALTVAPAGAASGSTLDYMVAGPFSTLSACNAERLVYAHDGGYQVMTSCYSIVGDWFFEWKYK